MSTSFDRRSNIFGEIVASSSTPDIPLVLDPKASDASNLIEKLKNIADNELQKVAASVDWLALAANQGQNNPGNSLVQYPNVIPPDLTSATILQGWTNPAMPSLPTFPTLPSDLKVDFAGFQTSAKALVDALQSSWMAKFLPSTTDTSKYDTLMKDILSGTNDTTMTSLLSGYFNTMTSGLQDAKTTSLSDVNSQITAMYTALAGSIAGLQPMIDAGIATAQDNTGNIVFARGRDQIAREAARQEAEVLAEWAANGWSMPGGMLAAQQAAARQNTLDSASKIAAEEAVRTQQMNVDFAKTAIETWLRTADFQLRSNLEGMKAALEARLRYSAMQIEADRAVAELSIKNLGLRLDFSKFGATFALDYRKAAIDGMNGLIQAYAALNRGEMEYYAAIASAQRANLEALINYYRLALAQADMGIKVSMENVETKLKWAQIAGSFIAQCVGHHVQAAAATGQMYAQMGAAAVSGLNAVATSSVQS